MRNLSDAEVCCIEKKAAAIRVSVIESLIAAGSGHTAGPLGMADVFATLYCAVLRYDLEDTHSDARDRLILSNGHICPVLYAALAHTGFFPVEELVTLRKMGSRLQGHPHREYLPYVETSSGPLGSGLSQAVGMAFADRLLRKNDPHRTERFFYCLMGDGEQECGQIWEAAMLAGREQFPNLIGVIDRNAIQIDGPTKEVMPLEPLQEKYESFNWHVMHVDGHDIRALYQAFGEAQSVARPALIIAHTVPGKGVPAFERDFRWHGVPPGKGPEDVVPQKKQGARALAKLRTLAGALEDCECV